MKALGCAFAWGLVLNAGLAASSLYQIEFTGTITSGTASDFNLADNNVEAIADLTGLQVSGSMLFDLGTGPAAVVSTDGSGFVNTVIQSTGGPVFISESVQISGLSAPTGFIALPVLFNQPPVPALPGADIVTQVRDSQMLRFSTRPSGQSPQSALAGMNFLNEWTGPQLNGSETSALDMLISDGTPFFTVPDPGALPSSWGPFAPGGNGVFTFALLTQDAAIADHFGITNDYDVTGSFTFTSVHGGFVGAPEPGTFVSGGAALLLLVIFIASAAGGTSRARARSIS